MACMAMVFFIIQMNHKKELWADVPGYEGLYQVSNNGRIKSMKRRIIMKPFISHRGYAYIGLRNKNGRVGRPIHRLVCLAFHENPENKPTVNHIDGDKMNNHADNLEWATWSENNKHARVNKLNVAPSGENCYIAKLTEKEVREIRLLGESGFSNSEIAKKFPVTRKCISLIINRVNWKHI